MRYVAMMVLAFASLSCAISPDRPGAGEDFGFGKDKRVWVRGPWPDIEPSRDIDAVIDQLCPAIMRLPQATWREYGQEYCGGIYTLGDGLYHASYASPLGEPTPPGPAKRKTCYPPREVRDARGRAFIAGDFHSHPWFPSPLSVEDRQAATQLWHIRIQLDSKCTIQKLVPHVYEEHPGEVYERQGKSWKLIGIIKQEDKASGRMTPVGGE